MIQLPKLINKAELARRMGIEPQNLNNKLKGANRQSFTEDDKKKVISAIKQALDEVSKIEV